MNDWIEKCLTCTHCYKKNDDADTLYCRCAGGECHYKEHKATKGGDIECTVEQTDLTKRI